MAAAGFGTSGPFINASPDVEAGMLAVNCDAVWRGPLVFGRRFAARGRGGIVMSGSIVGFQGTPWAAHYAATKAYVQTLGERLHAELRPRGVDVLVAEPGPVRTGFAARAGMTMGAVAQPEAVAEATLRAFGRRPTTYPGRLTKVLAGSLAPLPRALRTRIMGRIMQAMTTST